ATRNPPPKPSRTAATGAAVSPRSHLCAPGLVASSLEHLLPPSARRALPPLSSAASRRVPVPAHPRLLSGADAETSPLGGISEQAARVAKSCPLKGRGLQVAFTQVASAWARGRARVARSSFPTCKLL
ncbi:hypothetical protein PVAP13_7KG396070, partial [Panicum virgatum]